MKCLHTLHVCVWSVLKKQSTLLTHHPNCLTQTSFTTAQRVTAMFHTMVLVLIHGCKEPTDMAPWLQGKPARQHNGA